MGTPLPTGLGAGVDEAAAFLGHVAAERLPEALAAWRAAGGEGDDAALPALLAEPGAGGPALHDALLALLPGWPVPPARAFAAARGLARAFHGAAPGPASRAERLLADALELAGIGVWVWDLATDAVRWSAQVYTIYGLAPSDEPLTSEVFTRTIPAEQREKVWGALRAAIDAGEPFAFQRTLVRPDGTQGVVKTRGFVEHDADGRPSAVVGCILDLTALAAAEEALVERSRELARQRELMRTLLDHAPATFAYVDRDLVYRWNNRAHGAVLGKPASAIIGSSAVQVAPGIVSRTEPLLRAALERGEVGRMVGIPIRHATDDRPAHWDLTYVPVPGEDGRPMGVLVVGAEVTDRVAAERLQHEQIDRLRELDRLKDQFLSVVSHELRTPLNAVSGFGSILADGLAGELTPSQARYVDKMLAATDALLALIDDLLDMGRIQAGKFSLNPAPFAVGPTIEALGEGLQVVLARGGHRLETDVAPDLPVVRADARRVRQVLENLVTNAAKFAPAGSAIRVRARAEGQGLRVEVVDAGPGIAYEDRPRLFLPFSQLDTRLTREASGTGLGLSICKGLVEAHGGAIGVDSVPGAGATFWFTLPT